MGFIATIPNENKEDNKDPIKGKWEICASFGESTSNVVCTDSKQVLWEIDMYLRKGADKIEVNLKK